MVAPEEGPGGSGQRPPIAQRAAEGDESRDHVVGRTARSAPGRQTRFFRLSFERVSMALRATHEDESHGRALVGRASACEPTSAGSPGVSFSW